MGRSVRPSAVFIFFSLLLCLTSPLPGGAEGEAQQKTLSVAAASDLSFALREMARGFEKETGVRPVISFGSTGLLARQIEEGAPFDIFLAADLESVKALASAGLLLKDTIAVYARGRLALVVNRGSGVKAEGIGDLARPEIKRVAIANPAHAPYGKAAVEAVRNSGLWEAVKDKLVYGENIRQALQFVETGDAEAGIVALSIADVPDAVYFVIPDRLHRPIDQAAAVAAGAKNGKGARDFIRFLQGPEGRAILEKYRFIPKN